MLKLYKLKFNVGRCEYLPGIFAAEENDIKELIDSGKNVYYGEVLGNHSEVCGPLEEGDIEEVAADPEFVKKFYDLKLDIYNPLDYLHRD